MKNLFILSLFIVCHFSFFGQTISVKPYLQDMSPNSIFVLWETDGNNESIVEWGLTEELGNTSEGISYLSNENYLIHEVQLDNLERFTIYYYRVVTGSAVSAIYHFKTPPFATDNEAFRVVAMSDMQQDDEHPNKFHEIINDGILQLMNDELGGDIVDNIAMVLIPGDLVDTGTEFDSWRETFFEPAENLFSYVPVYPVIGNHELDVIYYYRYFKLPENGNDEHKWYKDYGNVRIIGLDSNPPFDTEEQLQWLDEVLLNTCDADSIDFVFAQLHHPFKSELWTPGESNFTGEVIQRMENFSTDCGKPSIHFFGHTHGYSRGQSRDHKHLWINVATAGGAIDNWGEFPNFDYNEFSISQDDYGFVTIEITSDDDPKLVIKRYSKGDQDVILENTLSDSLVMRLYPSTVFTPEAFYPMNQEIIPECVELKATPFSSPNNLAEHGQSHWQISTSQNNFLDLVFESWKNYENWYNEIDTQASDDLTDEYASGLEQGQNYWWRVRYRDREFNWSDWSTPVSFSVGESVFSQNLLQNPGAENDLEGWSIDDGVVEAVTDGECAGISPNSGLKYFAVGGLCDHSEVGKLSQLVDLSDYQDSIDAGLYSLNFGGYLSDYSGTDLPSFRVSFIDNNDLVISLSPWVEHSNNVWTLYSERIEIPSQTIKVRLELKGVRYGGEDNDSYFDDMFVKIGPTDVACEMPASTDHILENTLQARIHLVHPNPLRQVGTIDYSCTSNTKVVVVDSKGKKVFLDVKYQDDKIQLENIHLSSGTYFFWIREGRKVVGTGRFLVE